MSTSQSSDLEYRHLPDSADARLFVELSSYQADLTEARTALELAIAGSEDSGPLGDAHQLLIGYAAIAYCRTYFDSKVRAPLTDRVTIPDEHSELHNLITDYRNKRVAHSQSHLASTFAFIGLGADGSIRPGVVGLTLAQEIPTNLLEQWITLIDAISDHVSELQNEVEARIIQDVAAIDLREVRSWQLWPARVDVSDSSFTARPSRGRYPTTWTRFWSRSD